MRRRALLAATVLFVASTAGHAATITYVATQVSGDTWRYDYTVINGPSAPSVKLLDILFDPVKYDEATFLVQSTAAITAAWDEQFLASGLGVPAAYDALANGTGIAAGASAGGFAVQFRWKGTGTPGPQPFEIYDANTFALLGTGTTTPVPLPGALGFLAAGLGAIAARARPRQVALVDETPPSA